jgi:two-component system CheB/CheR fusion protein
MLLHAATGVDFRRYKPATIERRATRRMERLGLRDLGQYARRLEHDPAELQALFRDVLILVTRFFRDPEAFEALRDRVLPALLARHGIDDPIRVWSAGCSTGEEAYSIAILLLEYVRKHGIESPITVFATDVGETALEQARRGVYPPSIAAAVSASRLDHFFTRSDRGYVISKAVRELCIFARHDVTRDPPYSNLDLVLCRNVLIYMDTLLQRDVLARLHYALKPEGALMLGAAETIAGHSPLFRAVDRRHCLYVKEAAPVPAASPLPVEPPRHAPATEAAVQPRSAPQARFEAKQIIARRRARAAIMVDGDLQIVRFYGRTGRYLALPPGRPTLNLLRLAREGLLHGIRTAVDAARQTFTPARCDAVRVKHDGVWQRVRVDVIPLARTESPHFLVLFDAARPARHSDTGAADTTVNRQARKQRRR